MQRESIVACAWGLFATAVLAVLVLVGSRNLSHFDAALVAYTFAVLFATFGLTYRYAMWLQRPPTWRYFRRGWQTFLKPSALGRNLTRGIGRVLADFAANRFIFRRDPARGLAHFCLMWGCIISVAITFPLVFGWLQFVPANGDLSRYRAMVFGFAAFSFPVHSGVAFLLFHGLVWAALLVVGGVMLAMRRRMQEGGAGALQRFAEAKMPLVMLFAVSITGLMLTASYTWMEGYAYEFISILHAITVIGTFIWLPFGKFFHIFQRPAQLAVTFYKDEGSAGEKAHCRRCGHAFTSLMHVEDLIAVERALGYAYEVDDPKVEHYQWICPPCRRATVAQAQARLWEGERGGHGLPESIAHHEGAPRPMPAFVNVCQGALGREDEENFHP
jgi:hypothetical protein